MRLLLLAAAAIAVTIGTLTFGALRILTDTGPDW